jgi:hypothetical protein
MGTTSALKGDGFPFYRYESKAESYCHWSIVVDLKNNAQKRN